MRNTLPRYIGLLKSWKDLGIISRYSIERDLMDGRAEYSIEFVDGTVLVLEDENLSDEFYQILEDENLDGAGLFTLTPSRNEIKQDSAPRNNPTDLRAAEDCEQVNKPDVTKRNGRTIRMRNSAEGSVQNV